MRLNGWQRIGLIASAVWIIGGGLWTRSLIIDDVGKIPGLRYELCTGRADRLPAGSDHRGALDTCSEQFDVEYHTSWDDHYINSTNALFTLVPLLLVWL